MSEDVFESMYGPSEMNCKLRFSRSPCIGNHQECKLYYRVAKKQNKIDCQAQVYVMKYFHDCSTFGVIKNVSCRLGCSILS